jgi:hypothetical protein
VEKVDAKAIEYADGIAQMASSPIHLKILNTQTNSQDDQDLLLKQPADDL